MKWIVENHLTDVTIGVVEADSAREAIDAAYQAKGWKGFADAREQRATAAQEHEIMARRIDENGVEFGPYLGYATGEIK
jgi:hypothetical protein